MRRFQYTKYGLAENPVGHHITWESNGRTHLAEVTGVYRREMPAAIMLRTRYFCGEDGPDVCALSVKVLERDFDKEPTPEDLAAVEHDPKAQAIIKDAYDLHECPHCGKLCTFEELERTAGACCAACEP